MRLRFDRFREFQYFVIRVAVASRLKGRNRPRGQKYHISSKPRTSTQVRDCPGLSGTTRDSLKRANEEVLRKTLGVLCLSPPVTTCVRAVLRKNEFEASYLFFCIYSGLVHFRVRKGASYGSAASLRPSRANPNSFFIFLLIRKLQSSLS